MPEALGGSGVGGVGRGDSDDRDVRAGEKFADADLIGIPTRLVVSEKTVSAGGIEISNRTNGKGTLVAESDIIAKLHAQK